MAGPAYTCLADRDVQLTGPNLFVHVCNRSQIVMFNKGAGNQALVQYPDVASAQAAYEQVRRPTDKRTAALPLSVDGGRPPLPIAPITHTLTARTRRNPHTHTGGQPQHVHGLEPHPRRLLQPHHHHRGAYWVAHQRPILYNNNAHLSTRFGALID